MSRRRTVVSQPTPVAEGAEGVAKHVVISNFDSPGNPHYNGGGAVVVEMIADALAQHYQVTVLTARHRGKMAMNCKVRYRKLPIGWAGPHGGQLLFHAILPFAARRIPHDAWIESFTPPYSTSFIPLFSRAHVIGWAQGLIGKEMTKRYRLPFSLIERFGLRFYRHVVVLNSADHTEVRRQNPSAVVRIIPNGIDLPLIDEAKIGSGDYILFLGRINIWHKGLDLLLAAYKKSGVDLPLLVAGNGTRRDEHRLEDLIAAIGGNVHWLGRVTGQRKQHLLERSAFLAMPSRNEAFGLCALEAMSWGKPVLHFDLPALRWIEGDARVPPYDIDVLAAEIRHLAGDEAARRDLGRRGHTASQRYSRDEAADRYVALLQELFDASSVDTSADSPLRQSI